ncbi:hypothetical protein [Burkholderia sp. MSMB1459WGS]|uniref:hypothetical protein n=1 Tax=Burkholderia sp. MSMB1459WGS TaxID=1637970 RepID=UPI00211D90FB|nr:hypothetical protein [Burkholderia sp. MSMB1459WGS]
MICVKPAFSLHVSMEARYRVALRAHCRRGRTTAEEASMRSRIFPVLLAGLALLAGEVSTACANDLTRSVTTPTLVIHYGVVPASRAATPGGHAGDASNNVSLYLLTVALFDKSNGNRIEHARVAAVVQGPRSEASSFHSKPTRMQLDPTPDGNAVTYGNVFDARWKGVYHIDLTITGDGLAHPEHVRLNYDQQF